MKKNIAKKFAVLKISRIFATQNPKKGGVDNKNAKKMLQELSWLEHPTVNQGVVGSSPS